MLITYSIFNGYQLGIHYVLERLVSTHNAHVYQILFRTEQPARRMKSSFLTHLESDKINNQVSIHISQLHYGYALSDLLDMMHV